MSLAGEPGREAPEVCWTGSVLGRDHEIQQLAAKVSRERVAVVAGWVGRGKRSVAGAVAQRLVVQQAVEGGVLTVCLGEQATRGYGRQEIRSLIQLQASSFMPHSSQMPMCALDAWLSRLSPLQRGLLIIERCNSAQEELEHVALSLLSQSENVLLLLTSSYISWSWRQHGWFILELAPLPLATGVQILQQAAEAAGRSVSTLTAKTLCGQLCPHTDPIVLKAIGYVVGKCYIDAEELLKLEALPPIRDEALVALMQTAGSVEATAALSASAAVATIIFSDQIEKMGVAGEVLEAAVHLSLLRKQDIFPTSRSEPHAIVSICEGFNNKQLPSEYDLAEEEQASPRLQIGAAACAILHQTQTDLQQHQLVTQGSYLRSLHHTVDITALWCWRNTPLGDQCQAAALSLALTLKELGQLIEASHLFLRSFMSSPAAAISESRKAAMANACLPFMQCCNLLDQPALALSCLDASHAHMWGTGHYKLERARLHIQMGQHQPACSILVAAVDQLQGQQLGEAQVLLGLCRLLMGQPAKAEESLRPALAQGQDLLQLPKPAVALLVFALEDQGKLAEGEAVARQAASALEEPNELRLFYVQLSLLTMLVLQGKLEEARPLAAGMQLAIFQKAHHKYGPAFGHRIASALQKAGTRLEDIQRGLKRCQILRSALDTATVSLAAWQLLRSNYELHTFPHRIYHSDGATAQNLGLLMATIAAAAPERRWRQYGARLLSTMVAELEAIELDRRHSVEEPEPDTHVEDVLAEARRQLAAVQQRATLATTQADVISSLKCVICDERPCDAGCAHGRSVHRCICRPCASQLMTTPTPVCPVCHLSVDAVVLNLQQLRSQSATSSSAGEVKSSSSSERRSGHSLSTFSSSPAS